MKVLTVPSSGSHDGLTASRNRFGQYIRTRATPVNPNTAFQIASRGSLADAAVQWRALSDVERLAFQSAASGFTRVDSLGQAQTFNGFMLFVSLNNVAKGIDPAAALITVPPAVATFDSFTAELDGGVAKNITLTGLAEDDVVAIDSVVNISTGINFYKGFKRITTLTLADPPDDPVNIGTELAARFGAPVVGTQWIVRCRQVINNQLGPIVEAKAVITA